MPTGRSHPGLHRSPEVALVVEAGLVVLERVAGQTLGLDLLSDLLFDAGGPLVLVLLVGVELCAEGADGVLGTDACLHLGSDRLFHLGQLPAFEGELPFRVADLPGNDPTYQPRSEGGDAGEHAEYLVTERGQDSEGQAGHADPERNEGPRVHHVAVVGRFADTLKSIPPGRGR